MNGYLNIQEIAYKTFDKQIEQRGLQKGVSVTLSKMIQVRISRKDVHDFFVQEVLDRLDEFEYELHQNKILPANMSIGAYKVDSKTITLYLVSRVGNVKIM